MKDGRFEGDVRVVFEVWCDQCKEIGKIVDVVQGGRSVRIWVEPCVMCGDRERDSGYESGYESGYDSGYESGYDGGYEAAEEDAKEKKEILEEEVRRGRKDESI